MPRSKGFELKYERVMDFGVKTSSTDPALDNGSASIRRNRRISSKVRIPLVVRPGFKALVGLAYFREDFGFENPDDLSNPLYRSLEDKSLRAIGARLYLIKPTYKNRYYLFRGSISLNGDYNIDTEPNRNFIRFSLAPLIGFKPNSRTSYAIGVAYSYNFGRGIPYPIFSYNRAFNDRWGFESFLPVNAKLRYSPNDKWFAYWGVELQGANYNVRLGDSVLTANTAIYLEKSEVRTVFRLERELHDWLWVGAEGGWRYNIDFDLSDSFVLARSGIVADNSLGDALLFNVGIFIVPPRKFLEDF